MIAVPKIPDDRQLYLDYEYLQFKRPDLYRATMQDYDSMVELYSAARSEDDPLYADEYPSPEQIRSDIENGYLWYGVDEGEIVLACAITPEPVFPYEWTLAMRMPELPRLPGENWFRPGERYLSVLRFAVRYRHRRRGLIHEMLVMAFNLAYECGIYELRTRMNVERRRTGQFITFAGFKVVGAGESPEGRKYFGFYRRDVSKYAQQTESKRYRPEEDDHDLDAYHEYDFLSHALERERLEWLQQKYDSAPSDDTEDGEDLMEDI